MLGELLMIMGLAVLIWFWLNSMSVNEVARSIGSKICRKNNVQFLDDTVHLTSMRIGKNKFGQLKFIRKYEFEFTNSEIHRYTGEITLADKQLLETKMEAYRINEINYDL